VESELQGVESGILGVHGFGIQETESRIQGVQSRIERPLELPHIGRLKNCLTALRDEPWIDFFVSCSALSIQMCDISQVNLVASMFIYLSIFSLLFIYLFESLGG
jgi:hypothetical protein